MHSILVRYLQHKSVTCKPTTVSCLATRLAHFGTVIAAIDPDATPATLTRTMHIEPWMHALTRAENTKSGGVLSRAEQARRILAVANFLREISEWDWPEAPARPLRRGRELADRLDGLATLRQSQGLPALSVATGAGGFYTPVNTAITTGQYFHVRRGAHNAAPA